MSHLTMIMIQIFNYLFIIVNITGPLFQRYGKASDSFQNCRLTVAVVTRSSTYHSYFSFNLARLQILTN